MGLGSFMALPVGVSNETSPVKVRHSSKENNEYTSTVEMNNSASDNNIVGVAINGKQQSHQSKVPFSSPSFTDEVNLECNPEDSNEEKNLSWDDGLGMRKSNEV